MVPKLANFLVCTYYLSPEKKCLVKSARLFLDDGLACLHRITVSTFGIAGIIKISSRSLEKIKVEINQHNKFKNLSFLDFALDLSKGNYQPYKKIKRHSCIH